MALSLTVNGVACSPDLCQISVPGQYSFNANAFVADNQIDVRYQLQSIQPQGGGGIVSVFVQSDQVGASITGVTVPIGTGRETDTASTNDSGTFVNITLTVGANQSVGGDWLGTIVPLPPVCTTCVPVTPPGPPVPLPTLSEWGIWGLDALIVIVFAVFLRVLWSKRS